MLSCNREFEKFILSYIIVNNIGYKIIILSDNDASHASHATNENRDFKPIELENNNRTHFIVETNFSSACVNQLISVIKIKIIVVHPTFGNFEINKINIKYSGTKLIDFKLSQSNTNYQIISCIEDHNKHKFIYLDSPVLFLNKLNIPIQV